MIKIFIKYSIITLIWLGVWQIAAMISDSALLFPTPIAVAVRLFELMLTADFYKTVGLSLLRILVGMVIGTLVGALGGLLTASSRVAPRISNSASDFAYKTAVWPPLASRVTNGGFKVGESKYAAAKCPRIWLTAMSGLFNAYAKALAKDTPTSNAPSKPAP